MFTIMRKFKIEASEVMDFVRLLGRFGLKFKISDEHLVENPEQGSKEYFRTFIVYATRRQMADFLDAREIIYEYHLH